MTSRFSLRPLAVLAATLLASSASQAVDFGGYFRAGPGGAKKDASRACYGLNGPGLKYRLGNECDFYGEFLLSQGFQAEGVEYKAHLMTNLHEANTNGDTAKLGINQMYAEAKGFDVAPQTTFWIGKRFHGRADVHIVDTFFTNLSGTGAGFDTPIGGVGGAGGAKLGVSYFKTDASATDSGNRINVDAHDIAANPGGKLRFVGTLTEGRLSGQRGTTGVGLIAMHVQDNFLGAGGSNTMWAEYAQGSAGLDGNFGGLNDPSSHKKWRIVESFTFQTGPVGGQTIAMWQRDKTPAGQETHLSLGGRVSYALTKNFKLVTEIGHSQVKPDGGATAKLTKFTFAPTLSTGPGFWNRPELRLYVTSAKWNAAANALATTSSTDNIVGSPAFSGKTSGTSYGAQVEMWF